jgi:hypothetical protein
LHHLLLQQDEGRRKRVEQCPEHEHVPAASPQWQRPLPKERGWGRAVSWNSISATRDKLSGMAVTIIFQEAQKKIEQKCAEQENLSVIRGCNDDLCGELQKR